MRHSRLSPGSREPALQSAASASAQTARWQARRPGSACSYTVHWRWQPAQPSWSCWRPAACVALHGRMAAAAQVPGSQAQGRLLLSPCPYLCNASCRCFQWTSPYPEMHFDSTELSCSGTCVPSFMPLPPMCCSVATSPLGADLVSPSGAVRLVPSVTPSSGLLKIHHVEEVPIVGCWALRGSKVPSRSSR